MDVGRRSSTKGLGSSTGPARLGLHPHALNSIARIALSVLRNGAGGGIKPLAEHQNRGLLSEALHHMAKRVGSTLACKWAS